MGRDGSHAGRVPRGVRQRDVVMKRLPLLAEVVDMAVVLASDRSRAMTGTFVDVACGG